MRKDQIELIRESFQVFVWPFLILPFLLYVLSSAFGLFPLTVKGLVVAVLAPMVVSLVLFMFIGLLLLRSCK